MNREQSGQDTLGTGNQKQAKAVLTVLVSGLKETFKNGYLSVFSNFVIMDI